MPHLVDKHPVLVVGDISRADVLLPHLQHLVIRHALPTKNIFTMIMEISHLAYIHVEILANFATYILSLVLIFLSWVKDCIEDMVTFTALVKKNVHEPFSANYTRKAYSWA